MLIKNKSQPIYSVGEFDEQVYLILCFARLKGRFSPNLQKNYTIPILNNLGKQISILEVTL